MFFTAPTFKDDTQTGILLPNPTSPARTVTLHAVGYEAASQELLFSYEIVMNTSSSEIGVQLTKVEQSTADTFDFYVCFHYEQWPNL